MRPTLRRNERFIRRQSSLADIDPTAGICAARIRRHRHCVPQSSNSDLGHDPSADANEPNAVADRRTAHDDVHSGDLVLDVGACALNDPGTTHDHTGTNDLVRGRRRSHRGDHRRPLLLNWLAGAVIAR